MLRALIETVERNEKYKKAILLVSIMVPIPSLFLIYVGIVTASIIHLVFWGAMIFMWWGVYLYLRKDKRFSFWCSFVLVKIFWWLLLLRTIMRIEFVIENGGMERADGYGSPGAFLIGLVEEQIFFIPLTVAMALGVMLLISSNKSLFRADAKNVPFG